jgi:hypothetical protein
MIRFEKGLGDHYRMALERVTSGTGAVTQAQQDALVEGDWVNIVIDAAGALKYTLMTQPTAGATGVCSNKPVPCISNPVQPDHTGPFVPMGFAMGQSDLVYTDRYDTTTAGKALYSVGAEVVAKAFCEGGDPTNPVINGVVPRGYKNTGSIADPAIDGTVSTADAPYVIGIVVGFNADDELVFLWKGF